MSDDERDAVDARPVELPDDRLGVLPGEVEATTRGLASGIYGLVIAGATLAASSESVPLYKVATGLVITLLIYWAAESYAHALARRTIVLRPLTRPELWTIFHQGWGLVTASYAPLAALLVARLVGLDAENAVDVALVVVTVLLGSIGWKAGRSSGVVGWRLVGTVAMSILLGVVMVLLKWYLH